MDRPEGRQADSADVTDQVAVERMRAAVAAAGGIALGAVGRAALAAFLRRRESGPRQHLVDLEPPESSEQGSGQADPNPAKAPSLVLDLGDLYPADVPR
jgi:hypothetical protein